MEKILNTKDIIGLTLTLENDRKESYGLPYLWKTENWLKPKYNCCQNIKSNGEFIELSFNYPKSMKGTDNE